MKTTKLLMGSVSALLGGVILASGADTAASYTVNVGFTNTPPIIVNVDDLPVLGSTALNPGDFDVIMTDGAGRLSGVTSMNVTNLTDTAPYVQGSFIANVSGSIRSVGKSPVSMVTMSVKGNGFLEDATGTAITPATAAYTFSGKLTTLSSSVPTPQGATFTLVTSNAISGLSSTNAFNGPYNPTTNTFMITTNDTSYSYLAFTVNQSSNVNTTVTSSNTVVNQNNFAFIDGGDSFSPAFTDQGFGYAFGTPVASNVLGSVTFSYLVGTGSNAFTTNMTFNWYPIGTNIDAQVQIINGNTNFGNTFASSNAVPGLPDTNVAAFVAAYIASQTVSNSDTNFLVVSVLTNQYVSAGSGSFSNTAVTTLNLFSNTWFEVDGTLKGAIKGKKVTHTLNKETAAFFDGSHTLYSSSTDTNGVVIVLRQTAVGNNVFNASFTPLDFLDGRVVSVNSSLWMSAAMDADFGGSGSLNNRKNTYSASLTGAAWSRGSSAKLSGSTGLLLINAGTNVVTLTNSAASPLEMITYTNSNGFLEIPFLRNVVTNTVNGTNIVIGNNGWILPIPGTTNSVPNGIKTMTVSGKVAGQIVPKISGINPDFGGDF